MMPPTVFPILIVYMLFCLNSLVFTSLNYMTFSLSYVISCESTFLCSQPSQISRNLFTWILLQLMSILTQTELVESKFKNCFIFIGISIKWNFRHDRIEHLVKRNHLRIVLHYSNSCCNHIVFGILFFTCVIHFAQT